MLISTKGRYALRVMIDLAEQNSSKFIPLKDIAARQNISHKYLELIMAVLSKNGFVHGVCRKGGGYRLTKSPAEYTAGDILRITEGDALVPVACLASGAESCANAEHCRTLPLWQELDKQINGYLDSITIADLAKQQISYPDHPVSS